MMFDGWVAKIVARSGSEYMILLRPADIIGVDKARLDDVAIIADAEAKVRQPPWFLQLYLKFDSGWEDCPHDPALLEELLCLPETPRNPGYQDDFDRMRKSLEGQQG